MTSLHITFLGVDKGRDIRGCRWITGSGVVKFGREGEKDNGIKSKIEDSPTDVAGLTGGTEVRVRLGVPLGRF